MGFHRNAQARLRHLSYAAPVFVDITRSVYQVNNVTSSEPESLRMDRAYAVYDRVFWACLLWCVLFCIDLSTDAFKTTCLILYVKVRPGWWKDFDPGEHVLQGVSHAHADHGQDVLLVRFVIGLFLHVAAIQHDEAEASHEQLHEQFNDVSWFNLTYAKLDLSMMSHVLGEQSLPRCQDRVLLAKECQRPSHSCRCANTGTYDCQRDAKARE